MVAWAFVERFSNISLIGNVSCPTLFIHGEKDSLVPLSQSVSLFKQVSLFQFCTPSLAKHHQTKPLVEFTTLNRNRTCLHRAQLQPNPETWCLRDIVVVLLSLWSKVTLGSVCNQPSHTSVCTLPPQCTAHNTPPASVPGYCAYHRTPRQWIRGRSTT